MDANEKIAELMFKVFRLMKDEMSFTCFAAKLSLLQLHTLIYIKKQNVVRMSDIAAEFHIELPTATSLLNKLVSLKLVKRQAAKTDRRLVQIVLTENGEEVLREAYEQRKKKLKHMLLLLEKNDRVKLEFILGKLVSTLEKRYEK